ncbi:tyrosine-protein phosphatase [Bdellovibrio sp. SKB1291214]|uniref:tyrosine-protein phosphatase n=1 Tax=Bdellovibrio sp. SKB1291214 TaxID=1732569 RepID=UPI001595CCEB|nr:tyrosine-protein phosphatase [Bdellovibrio sp. SKB1291214]UYL07812.1 tyrosine-protein phosphatase [Bdellovibrio sp. SKB1291214]
MNLKGAINFRDLGGQLSVQGHKLKSGQFYRSGALSKLTADDVLLLQTTIGHVIDFRDPSEAAHDKDVLWEGVSYENCPANPVAYRMSANLGSFFTKEHLENIPPHYMEKLYRQLPFDNSAYRRMFAVMDEMSGKGMLQHCAVGKDRTGVGSALMLLGLGIDESQVMKDYLLTQTGLEPFRNGLMIQFKSILSDKAMEGFQYMMGAHESFLSAAIEEMKSKAGSIQKFLLTEYGITEERQAKWQQKFFES